MTITLGMTAKDKITGFQGVVVGYCLYLSGCNQALLCPPVNDKGEHRESHWYDVQRLEQVGSEIIALENGASPGFDKEAPKR